MLDLSFFQRLPLHIAEKIARFLVAKDNACDDYDLTDSDGQVNAWIVLYNISHFWRMLALQHFCREVGLEISARVSEMSFIFTYLPENIKPSVEYYRYVKTVSLLFHSIPNHPSEGQHRCFSVAWPENVVFSMAHTLAISITGGFDQPIGKGVAIGNKLFDWAAQRIPVSLPKLREARIEHTFSKSAFDSESKLATTMETNRLFQTVIGCVRKLEICAKPICLVANDLYFENNPGLVSLDYNCRHNIGFFHLAIQKTASTLENLKVHRYPMDSIRLLVFSHSNKPIVYSRLVKLDFEGTTNSGTKVRVGKSTAPFPVLKCLRWRADYAFEDGTLFRGNNETLEYLHITLGLELMDLLQRENVFSNGKYSKLRCIVTNSINSHSYSPANLDSLAKFTASLISSATRGFWTDIKYSYQNVMEIFSTYSNAGSLQVLAPRTTALTLEETIELLKILPKLTDLTCFIDGVDSEVSGHQVKTIMDYLHSKYYPLGCRLKHWTITSELHIPNNLIVTAAIVLSALCPSIVRISVPNGHVELIQHRLSDIISSGLFEDHARKLESIFYSEQTTVE